MLLKGLLFAFLFLFTAATSVSAMTKAELTEKILRKTGLTETDFNNITPERLEADEPNSCTPKSVASDLQKIVILCLAPNKHSGTNASKPKEIVVVGSKVFTLPTDFFDNRAD